MASRVHSASDITSILHPSLVPLEPIPPVTCMIWRGGKDYERIILDTLYPFDTIATLKQMVYNHVKNPMFLPRFIFMGIPLSDSEKPSSKTKYLPVDFLWY